MNEQDQVQDGHSVELEGQLRRMWEQLLPEMSPKFVADTVRYAVMVRRGRVLLLSNRHVIYCKARYLVPGSFRLRWYLDVANINNVLGVHPVACFSLRLYSASF